MLVRLNGMIRKDQKEKIASMVKPGRSENAIVRDMLDFYFNNHIHTLGGLYEKKEIKI